MRVSAVIPSYGREKVLLNSIESLLALEEPADEIIVVDQTQNHLQETAKRLRAWHDEKKIIWIQREEPSITRAMNHGLKVARNPLVLFVDDDIVAKPGLISNHALTHEFNEHFWVTAGQVIQPWQQPEALEPSSKLTGLKLDFDFPFNSTLDGYVTNVIGCNFCVKRDRALFIGGFDDNYIGSAFRFETDFAKRIVAAGGQIRFVAAASIDHLRVTEGGTRHKGSHMTSASPLHGFGDYYYALKHGTKAESFSYSFHRFFREVRTRFHLTHPWWIPVKMVGEVRAIMMARRIYKKLPESTQQ